MKYFLLILFFLMLQLALAQKHEEILNTEINIKAKQKSIGNILDQIEQKANVTFSYNNSVLDTDSVIGILVFKGKLKSILKKLMPPDISYIISSRNIIFYQSSKNKQEKKKEIDRLEEITTVTESILKSDANQLAHSEAEKVIHIKPVVIEDVSIDSFNKSIQNTHLSNSLIPVSFTSSINNTEKENTSKNVKHPNAIRRNNENIYGTKKVFAKYSVAPFYQLLNEKSQYNIFGIEEESERINDYTVSSKIGSISNRWGFKASVTFDHLKLTTGLALLTRNEKYRYGSPVDSANVIITTDTLANSLSWENTYHYLSVPLFIGYQGEIVKSLTINCNAGVWLNYLNSAKGKYINLISGPSHEINNLNDDLLYKIRTNLAADISLEYEFIRNTAVSFSVSYMYSIKAILKKRLPVIKAEPAIGYGFAIIRKF